jgi:glycosyltransferase involved in cell wall biosynthesis
MRTLHAVYPTVLVSGGVSYTLRELLDNMPGPLLRKRLWTIQTYPPMTREYLRPAFGRLLWRTMRKMRVPEWWQRRVVVDAALRHVQPGDIVYVWPPYSADLIRRARDRGAVTVAERVNCMGAMCKQVLDRAYARIGKPLPAGWCLPEAVAAEREEMALCDFVTAPSQSVARSLVEAGIRPEQILRTSYGWSPERLAGAIGLIRPDRVPVFAYVGLGIVRKGFNLLLEAWEKANIGAKLLIAGNVHDEVRSICARQLARPEVQELGYVRDVASVYAAADVFLLPTHEEGSPQVGYEAAGCGLASVVSPMGAVPIVRHGSEGFILDPYDTDAWAGALRTLAQDRDLCRRFGASAAERAKEYTWQKVGARLYEQFAGLTRA